MRPLQENYFSISKSTTELIFGEINQLKNYLDDKKSGELSFPKFIHIYLKQLRSIFSQSDHLISQKSIGFNAGKIHRINTIITKHNFSLRKVKCKAITNNLFVYQ